MQRNQFREKKSYQIIIIIIVIILILIKHYFVEMGRVVSTLGVKNQKSIMNTKKKQKKH